MMWRKSENLETLKIGNYRTLRKNGKAEPNQQGEALYNLEKDISESKNVIKENPEIANELKTALEAFEQTIKKEARPVGVTKNTF